MPAFGASAVGCVGASSAGVDTEDLSVSIGSSRGQSATAKDRAETGSNATSSLPQHVLVVEDSMIIALDTEENLKRLGVPSVAVAGSVAGALDAISKRVPDFAIVDFNLGDESSAPVAGALRDANVPFVLATGYSELGNQAEELGASSLLHKPYGRSEIEELLASKSE